MRSKTTFPHTFDKVLAAGHANSAEADFSAVGYNAAAVRELSGVAWSPHRMDQQAAVLGRRIQSCDAHLVQLQIVEEAILRHVESWLRLRARAEGRKREVRRRVSRR